MPVKFTENKGWDKQIENGMKAALLEMVTDIHRRAVVLAPIKDSHLRNSGQVLPVKNGYKVKFGSSKVPYARIHELGGKTGRNYAVKIKAKHYLGDAGDSVARGDKSKYFRNKV